MEEEEPWMGQLLQRNLNHYWHFLPCGTSIAENGASNARRLVSTSREAASVTIVGLMSKSKGISSRMESRIQLQETRQSDIGGERRIHPSPSALTYDEKRLVKKANQS